ncbi:hypothetical protein [Brevibacillus laterosporus]|uniref:hypothetical protein n=1 Tax=Brevibacillus laterosporus TaxID=1465 RepID=UPI001EF2659B|nr:hypothetical protein [Brevibacillus laterosporus]MCG7315698.1 hypothetical protein [Brevibacillus laterosporus]
MELLTEKKPIYDERVNEILRGLVEGKSRDLLAKELGHKNYKTLDIYMRRKNFVWDRDKQTYVPAYNRIEKWDSSKDLVSSSKISTIISLFQKEGADAKTIAKRLGFSDHRELATYMKSKGYKWSSDKKNYEKLTGKFTEDILSTSLPATTQEAESSVEAPEALQSVLKANRIDKGQLGSIEAYLPILELLDRNRDRLIDLIVPGSESGKVPRYAVPGIFVTKSVHMTNTLDQMVREYSKEKNISQRDIFAVALIEFFQRYGYEREIETLLGRL